MSLTWILFLLVGYFPTKHSSPFFTHSPPFKFFSVHDKCSFPPAVFAPISVRVWGGFVLGGFFCCWGVGANSFLHSSTREVYPRVEWDRVPPNPLRSIDPHNILSTPGNFSSRKPALLTKHLHYYSPSPRHLDDFLS